MSTEHPGRPRLYFIGVSTAQSSIRGLFPLWAAALNLDAELVGRDLSVGAGRAACRRRVQELLDDTLAAGALITTHKAALFDQARDRFASLDQHAAICREISCAVRRDGSLHGYAKDPITAGLAMAHIFGAEPPAAGHDVVCFGAGGAGIAIAVSLLEQGNPPRRLTIVDRDSPRITVAREITSALGSAVPIEYRLHSTPTENDQLLTGCRPGAFVINATGMGKDLPGAPISARAEFPAEAVVWDLNYRGELGFLVTAGRQADQRGLQIIDGWQYFLHGWTEVIAEVFGIRLTEQRFNRLAALAEPFEAPSWQRPARSGVQ